MEPRNGNLSTRNLVGTFVVAGVLWFGQSVLNRIDRLEAKVDVISPQLQAIQTAIVASGGREDRTDARIDRIEAEQRARTPYIPKAPQ